MARVVRRTRIQSDQLWGPGCQTSRLHEPKIDLESGGSIILDYLGSSTGWAKLNGANAVSFVFRPRV